MFEVIPEQQQLQAAQSLEMLIERFLLSLDVRASSRSTYRRQLHEFCAWQKKKKIVLPEREHLLAYKEYLSKERRLAALTICSYLTAMRKFFEWLESVKIYPNVAKGIKGPKRKAGFKKDSLTVDQVKRFLASINRSTLAGLRDYAMLNLMIRTGLRTIEIARACKEDLSQQSGTSVLFIHGKGRDSKDDLVVITENALTPLRDYLKARGRTRDEDPLFASHSTKNKGSSLTTRSVSRIVKNRLKEMGIDDSRITAHSLRHTAITLSLLAGATPQEARAMARHADINTTLIYAHNINRIAQAPEKKIDEFLE
jgi:integrase/recombinase XerD